MSIKEPVQYYEPWGDVAYRCGECGESYSSRSTAVDCARRDRGERQRIRDELDNYKPEKEEKITETGKTSDELNLPPGLLFQDSTILEKTTLPDKKQVQEFMSDEKAAMLGKERPYSIGAATDPVWSRQIFPVENLEDDINQVTVKYCHIAANEAYNRAMFHFDSLHSLYGRTPNDNDKEAYEYWMKMHKEWHKKKQERVKEESEGAKLFSKYYRKNAFYGEPYIGNGVNMKTKGGRPPGYDKIVDVTIKRPKWEAFWAYGTATIHGVTSNQEFNKSKLGQRSVSNNESLRNAHALTSATIHSVENHKNYRIKQVNNYRVASYGGAVALAAEGVEGVVDEALHGISEIKIQIWKENKFLPPWKRHFLLLKKIDSTDNNTPQFKAVSRREARGYLKNWLDIEIPAEREK